MTVSNTLYTKISEANSRNKPTTFTANSQTPTRPTSRTSTTPITTTSSTSGSSSSTQSTFRRSYVIDEKIIPQNTSSTSISNWTETILFARSRNVSITATGLKPLTKHYAFFDGVSVDKYITSKFIAINMISGAFQVGELVESDPLFTSGKFTFRLCTPNHYDGPYNNPSKTFNPNIVSFPLARTYGLTETQYSESSRSLNIDLNSLENPSEVLFKGYARPGMKLIGRQSGAIAEVVESILVTDESGFLSASFFIPDPTKQGNPRFINGTNTFTLTDRSRLSDPTYLSFAETGYYSDGTTNVTDKNNITTRNYTIIPAKTVNETYLINLNSNIITRTIPRGSGGGATPVPALPPVNNYNTTPSRTSSAPTVRYEGIATGFVPTRGTIETVNQNAGFEPSLKYAGGQPALGAAAVERAFTTGYSVRQIQDWVNRSGAIVGPEAQKLGIKPPPAGSGTR